MLDVVGSQGSVLLSEAASAPPSHALPLLRYVQLRAAGAEGAALGGLGSVTARRLELASRQKFRVSDW